MRTALPDPIKTGAQLVELFLDEPMQHYFSSKFPMLSSPELRVRIEEMLKFLFISHECVGAIPISKNIDDLWHAWILQTREYAELCMRLPARGFIHHTSNDYLRYYDANVGEARNLADEVKMLALYVANFGPFDSSRTQYWLLAHHLVDRRRWSIEQLNGWLSSNSDPEQSI